MTLADHIRSYLEDDEVALKPNDPDSEVRTNTWTYSVAESGPEHAPEVIAALCAVAEGLRLRLQGLGPGTFYAWYDEQSGQLRCSLTSRRYLPFGAMVRETPDPTAVVHSALTDPSPGTVDMSEAVKPPLDFREAPDGALTVWVARFS